MIGDEQYYLIIDTDGDFGLRINGKDFYQDEIRIKAGSFDKLEEAVNSAQVLEINYSKTDAGHALLENLRESLQEWYENVRGGNWSFEYGSLDNPCSWDLEV